MKGKLHKALVVVQTHINAQTEALGLAYGFLKQTFEEIKTSSVYLAHANQGKPVSNAGQLVFSATILTELKAEEINNLLAQFIEENPRTLEATLLAYDDETRMSPQLPLPHPELHLRPQWLLPAVEIWGDYPHPILGRPLHELAGEHDWGTWGRFYAQGEMLREFYSKRSK